MPIKPASARDVAPIATPFNVEGVNLTGTAVAMQFAGNAMNYLVVRDDGQSRPVWVQESEISRAYIDERSS